jgi:hypothetical protein
MNSSSGQQQEPKHRLRVCPEMGGVLTHIERETDATLELVPRADQPVPLQLVDPDCKHSFGVPDLFQQATALRQELVHALEVPQLERRVGEVDAGANRRLQLGSYVAWGGYFLDSPPPSRVACLKQARGSMAGD